MQPPAAGLQVELWDRNTAKVKYYTLADKNNETLDMKKPSLIDHLKKFPDSKIVFERNKSKGREIDFNDKDNNKDKSEISSDQ